MATTDELQALLTATLEASQQLLKRVDAQQAKIDEMTAAAAKPAAPSAAAPTAATQPAAPAPAPNLVAELIKARAPREAVVSAYRERHGFGGAMWRGETPEVPTTPALAASFARINANASAVRGLGADALRETYEARHPRNLNPFARRPELSGEGAEVARGYAERKQRARDSNPWAAAHARYGSKVRKE